MDNNYRGKPISQHPYLNSTMRGRSYGNTSKTPNHLSEIMTKKFNMENTIPIIPNFDRVCCSAPIISNKQFSVKSSTPSPPIVASRPNLINILFETVTGVIGNLLPKSRSVSPETRPEEPHDELKAWLDRCEKRDDLSNNINNAESVLAIAQRENTVGDVKNNENESTENFSPGANADRTNDLDMDGMKRESRFLRAVKERAALELLPKPLEENPVDSVSSCEDKLAKLKMLLSAKKSSFDCVNSSSVIIENISDTTVNSVPENPPPIAGNGPNIEVQPEISQIRLPDLSVVNDRLDNLKSDAAECCPDVNAVLKLSNEIAEEIKPVKAAVLNCEDKLAKIKEILAKKKAAKLKPRSEVEKTPVEVVKNEPQLPEEESRPNVNLCEENRIESEKHPDKPSREKVNRLKKQKRSKETGRRKRSECPEENSTRQPTISNLQNKSCDKHHKSDKCSKKHKRKGKGSTKMNIREDLAFNSDTDAKSPVYFSTETLEFHPPDEKKSAKKTDCKISAGIEKCKTFLSNLPINRDRPPTPKQRFSSTESEDCPGFDEIKGKFTGSDSDGDHFVIVFSDRPKEPAKPKIPKTRKKSPSECESEESFEICFVNEGNDCFANDDTYSDSATETGSDEEDSYSESEGSTTDSSGYVEENKGGDSENELTLVQCDDDESVQLEEEIVEVKLKSCMKKPRERRSKSPKLSPERDDKKVRFEESKPKVHKMIVWAHAYQQARIGPWERCARDAERFKQRITCTSTCLDWVLKREHRNRIFFQRFRPLLMRAIREEKEAKAKEAKRIKDEALRIKLEEEEVLRLKLEEEEVLRLKLEEEEALKVKLEEEEVMRLRLQVEEEEVLGVRKLEVNEDTILNDSGIRDCLTVLQNCELNSNEIIANG